MMPKANYQVLQQVERSYTSIGQGQRTTPRMSAPCARKRHSGCYKLKCTCKCHEALDSEK